MTSIVGGPAPVAQATPQPAGNGGDAARAEARHAAVAAASAREVDPLPKRDAIYGLKSSVTSHEASSRYDHREKVAERRHNADHGRGRHVDTEA